MPKWGEEGGGVRSCTAKTTSNDCGEDERDIFDVTCHIYGHFPSLGLHDVSKRTKNTIHDPKKRGSMRDKYGLPIHILLC